MYIYNRNKTLKYNLQTQDESQPHIMKSFRTELHINDRQRTACERHAGTGRFAYNWAIALVSEGLNQEEPKYYTAVDLHKLWVATFKKENKWVSEVSKCSPQQAFRDLEGAMRKFWKYKKETKGQKLPLEKLYKKRVLLKVGSKYIIKPEWQGKIPIQHHLKFPNFKKKNVSDSFFLETNTPIHINGNKIKLPRIGLVKTYEKELPQGVAKSVTISKQAGRWFIAYRIDNQKVKYKKKYSTVGVDLGIKTLATLSDGKVFESGKRYKTSRNKLARLQRKASRQYESYKKRLEVTKQVKSEPTKFTIISKNHEKTKQKIAKEHFKIACIRKDTLHKLTSHLAKNHSKVVIEDLNVSGMMKNHNLAGAIANGAFYEFKRQLTYKCDWYDTELVIADRFFASSKTCCMCGHKQEMPLKRRVFDCQICDNKTDRDLNASINLMNYNNPKKNAASSAVKACGDIRYHDASQVGVHEAGIKHQTQNSNV